MVTAIYKIEKGAPILIPEFQNTGIKSGFPSPAQDYLQKTLDLNELLIKNPDSTFLADVQGSSMIDAGIANPCRIIIDRAAEVKNNTVVVAFVNGEFTVKKFTRKNNVIVLRPCNKRMPELKPIIIEEGMELMIWGVVVQALVNPKEVLVNDSIS